MNFPIGVRLAARITGVVAGEDMQSGSKMMTVERRKGRLL
jgi:hypothetical protein